MLFYYHKVINSSKENNNDKYLFIQQQSSKKNKQSKKPISLQEKIRQIHNGRDFNNFSQQLLERGGRKSIMIRKTSTETVKN